MVKKPFLLCVRSQSFIPLRISKQAYIKHQCWHVITQPDARAKMISLCMKRSNHDMGSHKGARKSCSIGPNNCRMFNDVFKYGIPTGIIHTTTYFLMVICIVYIFM